MPRIRTGSFRSGDLLARPAAIGVSWSLAVARRRRAAPRALLPVGRRHVGAHRRTKGGAVLPAEPSASPAPHA